MFCGAPAAGEHELGFARAGFAEEGDALPVAEAADIVVELPVEARVPRGIGLGLWTPRLRGRGSSEADANPAPPARSETTEQAWNQ